MGKMVAVAFLLFFNISFHVLLFISSKKVFEKQFLSLF